MGDQTEVLKELDALIAALTADPILYCETRYKLVTLKALRHIVETVY